MKGAHVIAAGLVAHIAVCLTIIEQRGAASTVPAGGFLHIRQIPAGEAGAACAPGFLRGLQLRGGTRGIWGRNLETDRFLRLSGGGNKKKRVKVLEEGDGVALEKGRGGVVGEDSVEGQGDGDGDEGAGAWPTFEDSGGSSNAVKVAKGMDGVALDSGSGGEEDSSQEAYRLAEEEMLRSRRMEMGEDGDDDESRESGSDLDSCPDPSGDGTSSGEVEEIDDMQGVRAAEDGGQEGGGSESSEDEEKNVIEEMTDERREKSKDESEVDSGGGGGGGGGGEIVVRGGDGQRTHAYEEGLIETCDSEERRVFPSDESEARSSFDDSNAKWRSDDSTWADELSFSYIPSVEGEDTSHELDADDSSGPPSGTNSRKAWEIRRNATGDVGKTKWDARNFKQEEEESDDSSYDRAGERLARTAADDYAENPGRWIKEKADRNELAVQNARCTADSDEESSDGGGLGSKKALVKEGHGGVGIMFEDRPLTTGLHGPKADRDWHRKWGVVVDDLIPGGPADVSGKVRPGDVLVAVGDEELGERGVSQVAGLVLGPVGSAVTLKMRRGLEEYEVEVTRSAIAGQTVSRDDAERLKSRLRFEESMLSSKPGKKHAKGSSVKRKERIAASEEEVAAAKIVLTDHQGVQSVHPTIKDAVAACDGVDDTITLREGAYPEGPIFLSGCMTLEAAEDVPASKCKITSAFGVPIIACMDDEADVRIVGISLLQTGGSVYNRSRCDDHYLWVRGVHIAEGKATITHCTIKSEMGAGAIVCGGTADFESCNITSCGGDGIVAVGGGRISVKESNVDMCGIAGLYSRGFGSILAAGGCSVKDNAAQGVVASRGGQAEVFNSWVEGNGEAAVSSFGPGSEIKASNTDLGSSKHGGAAEAGGRGSFLRCRIVGNREAGVFCQDEGSVVNAETCQIEDNVYGVVSQKQAAVFAIGCIVRSNHETNLHQEDDGHVEGVRLPDDAPIGADVLYPPDTLFDDVPTQMLAEGDP